MDIRSVTLHPEFPQKAWVVIEQPRNEPYRMLYDPIKGTFSRRPHKSLFYERGFISGDYGWIGGSGVPPAPHQDAFFLTRQPSFCGEIHLGHICGVFLRQDNDHKFVAVDDDIRRSMKTADLTSLDEVYYQDLLHIFPRVDEGEGWFGSEVAYSYLGKKPH
jgi:inorganic pyrophosphatase